MVARVVVAGLSLALLLGVGIAPLAVAQCPQRINDCGDLLSLPEDEGPPVGAGPGEDDYEVTTNVVAAGIEMTATMTAQATSTFAAGALAGADAGVTGTLTITISNASASAPVHVRLVFGDPTGARYEENMTGFEFDYDPASGIEPRGEFRFEITAKAGASLVLPIQLSVEDQAGNHESAMAVLVAETPEAEAPGGWLVPAILGFLLGALLISIVMRLRTRRR